MGELEFLFLQDFFSPSLPLHNTIDRLSSCTFWQDDFSIMIYTREANDFVTKWSFNFLGTIDQLNWKPSYGFANIIY